MDLRVESIQVARRLLNAVMFLFKDIKTMLARELMGAVKDKPEFERHVEAWQTIRFGNLHTRQIVNGVGALIDKIDQLTQSCPVVRKR